ncbi:IclR family transcriptional regulator [Pacificoceanicola onchidii]|uniref:IclR family transcriptional regulator n=1 Tax=Pacificoceanicola onchidii TaxID=2562685 RepID=UPI0010A62F0C|nr:IclR family transcriptional regulator C-terminal domain-containing protein [Pacificoceanicola onchidii]
MSSVSKALELLPLFTAARPEIGLSQLCRLAGRDKTTTYRHLQALESTFFVEQNPLTKAYRLGPALMHLASVREITVPRKAAAQAALARLAEQTGETAHVSVLSGETMYSLASCESPRHATRVIIDITVFPLHATASGIAALAFGPDRLFDAALANTQAFTEATPVTEAALRRFAQDARATGFGQSHKSYEDDVQSISAPVFDQTGLFAGAVSVAAVASRFSTQLASRIMTHLIEASRQITRSWGGTIPPHLENAWAQIVPDKAAVETPS